MKHIFLQFSFPLHSPYLHPLIPHLNQSLPSSPPILYSGWNQTPSLLPTAAWEALITPLSYSPPTPRGGRPQQEHWPMRCFPTASTYPPAPLKHTHTQPPPSTTLTLRTTPMPECLNPVSKLRPRPDPVSLLDSGQDTEGWQIEEGKRDRKREVAAEKRCNREREMEWIVAHSGTKGRQSQHKPLNGSSIQRLTVYSLQEKSMNWNIPKAHRRHWQGQQHYQLRQREQRIMSNISMYQWS